MIIIHGEFHPHRQGNSPFVGVLCVFRNSDWFIRHLWFYVPSIILVNCVIMETKTKNENYNLKFTSKNSLPGINQCKLV